MRTPTMLSLALLLSSACTAALDEPGDGEAATSSLDGYVSAPYELAPYGVYGFTFAHAGSTLHVTAHAEDGRAIGTMTQSSRGSGRTLEIDTASQLDGGAWVSPLPFAAHEYPPNEAYPSGYYVHQHYFDGGIQVLYLAKDGSSSAFTGTPEQAAVMDRNKVVWGWALYLAHRDGAGKLGDAAKAPLSDCSRTKAKYIVYLGMMVVAAGLGNAYGCVGAFIAAMDSYAYLAEHC